MKEKLNEYVEILYQAAAECFCERLAYDTFHMTLHDLGNSPVLRDVAEELFENELKVIEKTEEMQKYKNISIRMKSKYIFNMVDTSLVLGLYPVCPEEYYRLMEIYSVFDEIKKLNYPLTPHITLAYYNVDGFDRKAAGILEDTVRRLNQKLEMELELKYLYYQKFRSMNDYINILRFI